MSLLPILQPTDVNATVTQQVNDLLAEAVPSIKKCHAHRVKAVLANTRQQIASYIANLPAHHAEMATLAGKHTILVPDGSEKENEYNWINPLQA